MEPSSGQYREVFNLRVSECLELWKANNIFKIFLLSFIVTFLVLILLLHNVVASRYLLIVLLGGVAVYLALLVSPFFKRSKHPEASEAAEEARRFPKTTVLAALVIVLLFVAAFTAIQNLTSPTPGYQVAGFQHLIFPNRTALSMTPISPSNECAWFESMNITTRQIAKQQGLPDCDYAWPHINLSVPTLFLEFENFTEFVYNLNNTVSVAGLTGIDVLCFPIPNASFQCWVPPATVSHLR